jgi:hypothetical protein
MADSHRGAHRQTDCRLIIVVFPNDCRATRNVEDDIGVEKHFFSSFGHTAAVWSFGSLHKLKAAEVITNCHMTLAKPCSLVLRRPPVCFIYLLHLAESLSISGRLRWLS